MTDNQILEEVERAMELGRQQGRREVAVELLAIPDPCDACYTEMCESCNKRWDWESEVEEKLEKIKEQNR